MKCSFCGGRVEKGRGIMYVSAKGEIYYFCSSKCRKNFNLKRDPKKVKWVRKKEKGRVEQS